MFTGFCLYCKWSVFYSISSLISLFLIYWAHIILYSDFIFFYFSSHVFGCVQKICSAYYVNSASPLFQCVICLVFNLVAFLKEYLEQNRFCGHF